MDIFEEFLRLLEFSDEEMTRSLPMWRNACKILGLTEEDVRFAAHERLPQYWDMTLRGVRKCIGIYIRELIEITRLPEYEARGVKILYCNMPSHPAAVYANKIAGGNNIHISHPDYLLATVLNAFFSKSTFLDSNAASCMNPMCGHCGMNRLRADSKNKGIIITPTVMWNWGLYCNEGHKTEELIKDMGTENWQYVLSTIPKDYDSKIPEAEDKPRVAYLAKVLSEGQKRVSEYTGIEVTSEHVVAAMGQYMKYITKVEELSNLMAYSDPQPISGNDMTIFLAPTLMAMDSGFKLLGEAIDVVLDEVKARVSLGVGTLPKGAPKLANQFVPFCVPWVDKMFQENGVNLSVNTFFAPASKQKKYFDRENIYCSIAQQWLSNPSAVNMNNEVELVCEILKDLPVDGIIYGFFSFDRWIGSLQKIMVKQVQEKTGVPYYYLEGDFWSDAHFSMEDRITRIQNIALKVKINHLVSGSKNGKK